MAVDIVRRSARAPGGKAVPRFGPDVRRIDAALREFFARTSVDPRRIVLVGFSDGAAYALSLGLANPDLFPGVVAFAPGFIKLPDRLQPGQRIFIAHGSKDSVIPFETGRRIAEVLSTSELAVRFRAFDGGHAISRGALDAAVPFALGETPAATDTPPRR
jgi:predicted esterase